MVRQRDKSIVTERPAVSRLGARSLVCLEVNPAFGCLLIVAQQADTLDPLLCTFL